MINEATVAMFMNTYRVSTAPKCSLRGDSSPREVTFSELGRMKCSVCNSAIPKQVAVEAVSTVPMMHLMGDVNVASGMEALRRSGFSQGADAR